MGPIGRYGMENLGQYGIEWCGMVLDGMEFDGMMWNWHGWDSRLYGLRKPE